MIRAEVKAEDVVRRLSDKEIESLHYSAAHYVRLKDRYLGIAVE